MPAQNKKLEQFETQLDELEALVREMENGEIPLEQAVSHFERGMALSKSCEELLKKAELKVQTLLADANTDEDDVNV